MVELLRPAIASPREREREMSEPSPQDDDPVVGVVTDAWSDYQVGGLAIGDLKNRLKSLAESNDGDRAIRRALSALAREVDQVTAAAPPEASDRRLADAMNAFLI